MRVLCSGAGGFIGRALMDDLVADGHEVHRIVHAAPGPGQAVFDLPRHRVDPARLAGGTLEGFDAAVHLAGVPLSPRRWGAAKREAIRASRIATTDALARSLASCARPPPVLVSSSAVGFYGDRGDETLNEASGAGTGFLADLCRAWEHALEPAAAAGIRVVSLRTGIVLGRGGGVLATQVPLFRLGLGGRLGSGRQWTSWISLADDRLEGPVNATAPAPARNAEYTAALARALSRSARLAIPAAVLHLALGDVADELLLASQRALPARLSAIGFSFTHPELDGALSAALGKP